MIISQKAICPYCRAYMGICHVGKEDQRTSKFGMETYDKLYIIRQQHKAHCLQDIKEFYFNTDVVHVKEYQDPDINRMINKYIRFTGLHVRKHMKQWVIKEF